MALTDINSEDRLVQQTFAAHLEKALGWESIYTYNAETFGPAGTLGRASEREVVLVRDLRAALARLNPDIPLPAREQAIEKLTRIDFVRSLIQHNREFYGFIRGGVAVEWRDALGETRHARAQVIDFRNAANNRFLAVRELKIQGVRVPHYNRRADLVCFVNGLQLVFIELKAVYRNIRAGFDDNLTDYLSEHSIVHAFHHNAFLVVSNGDQGRYDFKRSEQDQSTVKLIYENRGEKLGIARLDLNDRIADAVEKADLDPDQTAFLEKLLGQDYEVITTDDRLDKLAADFVDHCTARWQTGKSMLVCIDKITCARMFQRIDPRWQAKLAEIKALIPVREAALAAATDPDLRELLGKDLESLHGQAQWMKSTLIEIIISEAQNEVRDFQKWGFDIIPHRIVMKTGFQTRDGKRVPVEDAFKDPQHPFRIAIVCAMWLTGFDVECLATLYIDKPMRAHNLMQAIAPANRVFPGYASRDGAAGYRPRIRRSCDPEAAPRRV